LFKEREIIFGRIEFSILQVVSFKFMKCESLGMITQKKRGVDIPLTALDVLGDLSE
jgi:hypothetical protein